MIKKVDLEKLPIELNRQDLMKIIHKHFESLSDYEVASFVEENAKIEVDLEWLIKYFTSDSNPQIVRQLPFVTTQSAVDEWKSAI